MGFVGIHPLIVQMAIVSPVLLFAASAPARESWARAAAKFGTSTSRWTR